MKLLAVACGAESGGAALAALRRATRDRHAAIDRLMSLPRLAERTRYGRILQGFDAFLGPWEQAVVTALGPAHAGWLRQRSRRGLLQRDLRALGLRPLALAPRLPALPSPQAAWGSLYVLEGSALGGQVIARALLEAGVRPDSGGAYFHGWGPATGGLWREFRLLLDAQLKQPAAIEAACAAACQTFDALSDVLHPLLHECTAPA